MLANIRQRSAPVSRRFSPVTEWPEQVIGRESPVRGEYLQAIPAADEGDLRLVPKLRLGTHASKLCFESVWPATPMIVPPKTRWFLLASHAKQSFA